MRKLFFWFGIANILLGIFMVVYFAINIEVFCDVANSDRTKVEILFIPLAPIFTGIALMITGWPRKDG